MSSTHHAAPVEEKGKIDHLDHLDHLDHPDHLDHLGHVEEEEQSPRFDARALVPAASKSDLSPSDHFGFLTRFESIPDLFSVPDWIQFVRIWLAVSNILEC